MITTPIKKIKMTIYFENLTIWLHDFYVLNMYIKFLIKRILFTIRFINLFFMHNFKLKKFKFKHLVDNITIHLWFYGKFVESLQMIQKENIIRWIC